MRAPFSCGRLGASSTTPLRTSPGTPTPTAAISRSLPAAASTCWHIVSTIAFGRHLHQRILVVVRLGKGAQLSRQLVVHHQPRYHPLR